MARFAIGVDYGTNSCRSLVVNIESGEEIATRVYEYPAGEQGVIVDPREPRLARQHPGDYITAFLTTVRDAVADAKQNSSFSPDRVVGIGVDTTGSTPLPVNERGEALALTDEFRGNPHAEAWLWKDHTAHAEAEEITALARRRGEPYLAKCGGTYSSEWYWSKIARAMRVAPKVAAAAHSWVELADFVPAYITGNVHPDRLPRGICAAGHKAMYHADWGGLPSADFLDAIEPGLSRFRYVSAAVPSNHKAGGLTDEVARQVGLPAGIAVAVGAFDAHMGAVGAGCGLGTLVKIIGTSTCDCMVAPLSVHLPDIPGLCGVVPESILPGMYGLEAGQSAVGDIFNWFVKHQTPGEFGTGGNAHEALTSAAGKLRPGQSGLVALDWHNGNRTVLVDPLLSGLVVGQSLHTTAPEMYRALVEATAFGALTIINRLEEYGVRVERVVNCGGIAEKNPMVMQIYADICRRPMLISRSAQTCALGAAIFGTVAGGGHASVEAAQSAMTGVKDRVYNPVPANVSVYAKLYEVYRDLHDAFGIRGQQADLSTVMKRLIAIRDEVRGQC